MNVETQNQTEEQFSHVQSYLYRKSMLNLLEQSQRKEHLFLGVIESLTEEHTNKILDALIDWLETGGQVANAEENRLISELSGIDISEWVSIRKNRAILDINLAQCNEDVSTKEAYLKSLNPWKGKIFGSDEDKVKIKAATEVADQAKSKKSALEISKNECEAKAKKLAQEILKNTCANMHSLNGENGLFGKIRHISEQSMVEIERAFVSHTEAQAQLISELETNTSLLKLLYAREPA